jgi:hypothetical protein
LQISSKDEDDVAINAKKRMIDLLTGKNLEKKKELMPWETFLHHNHGHDTMSPQESARCK